MPAAFVAWGTAGPLRSDVRHFSLRDPVAPPYPLPMARRRPNSTWGGKRKGAGAPPGNLNGLVHGRYSRQVQAVRHLLEMDPRVRSILSRASARNAQAATGDTIKKMQSRRS